MATSEQLDLRKRWVEALRSGKYKQTVGTLHNTKTGGFCCLGVLCDIMELPTTVDPSLPNRLGYYDPELGTEFSSPNVLPAGVWQKVGLRSNNGKFANDRDACLSDMNDNGTSFEVIADHIENSTQDLFKN